MNKIVYECFSTKIVGEALREDAECLKKTFRAIEMFKTIKMHITMKHLNDCVKYHYNKTF
jgi:2'-5' RNA ligase